MKHTSIITGDVINSRNYPAGKWLKTLKMALNRYGTEPSGWQVYRGDSFQLETPVAKAMEAAIYIKAAIRQLDGLDVRMAIGIGDKTFNAPKITESNGTAFVNSGECFEGMKKNTLAIKSPWPKIDEEVNLYMALATLTMNNWTTATSSIIIAAIKNPELTQIQLAGKIKKAQSTTSASLARAGYDEIMRMEKRYTQLITGK